MQKLTQDFVQDGKTYMIVGREQGFQNSDLSKAQTGMMLASRIRGVLQLHLQEVDLQAVLRYDITGKRMLKHCMQGEMMGIAEYLGLLLQVVSTLEESSQHMLSMTNYVLDEEYIFVEGSLQAGTLHFTYIPVMETLNEEPVQMILSQLASRWMTSVAELSGNQIQRILRYCHAEDFTIKGIKMLLLELLGNPQQMIDLTPQPAQVPTSKWIDPAELRNKQVPSFSNAIPSQESLSSNARYQQEVNIPAQPATNPILQHMQNKKKRTDLSEVATPSLSSQQNHKPTKMSKGQSSATPTQPTPDQEVQPMPSAHRTYLLAGGALVTAMIWKFGYLSHSNDFMLYGCTALTVAIGLVIYMILKGKSPLKNGLQMLSFIRNKKSEEEDGNESWRWQADPVLAGGGALASATIPSTPAPDPMRWRDENIAAIFGSDTPEQSPIRSQNTMMNGYEQQSGSYSTTGSPIEFGRSSQASSIPNYHEDTYSQHSSHHSTEMLSPHMATVLLGQDSSADQGYAHSGVQPFTGYLERRENGTMQMEPIRLTRGSFIIGRAAEGVHYLEKSTGTSRNHVELEISDQQITIKDLSSRNGTILKGEPIVPYKEYLLHEGDTFTIAQAVYTLRLG
ncbi:DUF6382 domain-containing protein [Paenibacillus kyungheensis]